MITLFIFLFRMLSTKIHLTSYVPQNVPNVRVLYLINRHRKNFPTWLKTVELQSSKHKRSVSGNSLNEAFCQVMLSTCWLILLTPVWMRETGKNIFSTTLINWNLAKQIPLTIGIRINGRFT